MLSRKKKKKKELKVKRGCGERKRESGREKENDNFFIHDENYEMLMCFGSSSCTLSLSLSCSHSPFSHQEPSAFPLCKFRIAPLFHFLRYIPINPFVMTKKLDLLENPSDSRNLGQTLIKIKFVLFFFFFTSFLFRYRNCSYIKLSCRGRCEI